MDAVDGFSLMAPELAQGILNPTTDQPQGHPPKVPYPYPFPCLPKMSIIKNAITGCGPEF
ncbi:hypothetical protein DY000_02030510 [Brassica cretica]|uniref:Uncharacterized protein n=1 Tax=Brassica cretica TaxID=69181 RepID=A0ABQ7DIA8_BRACR|nr:hypothetical protein DY000_02030510 [Brassica cretica]